MKETSAAEKGGSFFEKRDELKAQNGDYIQSLVFQHIPMFEHYDVLKRVGKHEKARYLRSEYTRASIIK